MENFRFVIDPTGHFKSRNVATRKLVEATGFLPAFALGKEDTIAENLAENYAFFNDWSVGESNVSENGTFYYPGDPPLAPIMLIAQGTEKIYIYEHAIVARVEDGNYVGHTRMD
jgi:hypothetical protein